MGRTKLYESDVEFIEERRKLGDTIKVIASQLGVTHTTLIRFMRKQGMRSTRVTKAQRLASTDLPEKYTAGASITDLKREYGVDAATVKKALKIAEVPVRTEWARNSLSVGLQKLSEDDRRCLLSQYEEGYTLEKLAAQYRVSASTVRKYLEDNGVSLRPVGPRRKSAEEKRDTVLRRLYGISLSEMIDILDSQRGVCAICGCEPSHGRNHGKELLCVDHDHNTGKVRGLLCHTCNLGISYFSDSSELMSDAAKYLGRIDS